MSMTHAVLNHGACASCSTQAAIVWHDGTCPLLTVDIDAARDRAGDGLTTGDGGPRRNIKGREPVR